jgi:hypothetical protein
MSWKKWYEPGVRLHFGVRHRLEHFQTLSHEHL